MKLLRLRLLVNQTNHTWHITCTHTRDHFFTYKVFFLIEPRWFFIRGGKCRKPPIIVPYIRTLSLASNLQGCFVDLPIALDEINRSSTAVGKGSDLLCALVPSHCSGATRDCFNKDHRLVSSHPVTASKSFVVKCLASLLIDAWTPLGWVVKEVIGIQRLGCVSEGDNNFSTNGRGCRKDCL